MAQTSSYRLGDTFDVLAQIYERNSIADAGMSLDVTVHFGQDYNDASWNSVQSVFGNGDSELYGRYRCLSLLPFRSVFQRDVEARTVQGLSRQR